jgi:hypothetical protein
MTQSGNFWIHPRIYVQYKMSDVRPLTGAKAHENPKEVNGVQVVAERCSEKTSKRT